MATATKPLATVKLSAEKETKRMVKFATEEDGTPVRDIYVAKSAFPEGKIPGSITVTVA